MAAMADHDFAIYGGGLLPALVAGLLAGTYGRSVALVSRQRSAQRLPRRIDVALPLSARPADWSIVRNGEGEIDSLLATIGAKAGGIEVVLNADTGDCSAALDHLAHLAVGFGHQVRKTAAGWALRRVARLDAQTLQAPLSAWLVRCGVTRLEDDAVDAALSVLAGGDDLRDRLPAGQQSDVLASIPMLATLVVAPRRLEAPVVRYIDRGVTLIQNGPGLTLALVAGDTTVEARLASTLGGPFPVKRLASTRYRQVVPRDGAPLVGRLKRTKTFIVAGLGDAAPFYAPALARLLTDTASAEEKAWFAAHDPAGPRDGLAMIETVQ
jgi:hypothetical protein